MHAFQFCTAGALVGLYSGPVVRFTRMWFSPILYDKYNGFLWLIHQLGQLYTMLIWTMHLRAWWVHEPMPWKLIVGWRWKGRPIWPTYSGHECWSVLVHGNGDKNVSPTSCPFYNSIADPIKTDLHIAWELGRLWDACVACAAKEIINKSEGGGWPTILQLIKLMHTFMQITGVSNSWKGRSIHSIQHSHILYLILSMSVQSNQEQ